MSEEKTTGEVVSSSFIDDFIMEDLAEGGRCEGMQVHDPVPSRAQRLPAYRTRQGHLH